MNKTKISATIVADSLSPQGDRLTSVLVTFPRIILSEINTHRMLSKNTSSSRAIPFKKMVEAVQNNPFIPIAWQKHHSGMQGNEYWDVTIKGKIGELDHTNIPAKWLRARNTAVTMAEVLYYGPQGVTKQLCNRLLEPFMWTTMLITGSKGGWNNFFKLRCPQYALDVRNKGRQFFKSKKDFANYVGKESDITKNGGTEEKAKEIFFKYNLKTDLDWLKCNLGQAEIHIMTLAEEIYDAMNESTPKQLQAGEWHIPFEDKIPFVGNLTASVDEDNTYWRDYDEQNKVKISVASAARTSYTVVGEEKEIDYSKMIELHDRLISQNPPHSSPLEHCARVMSDDEYVSFIKGQVDTVESERFDDTFVAYNKSWNDESSSGWCNNLKGFISYRYMIDNKWKS